MKRIVKASALLLSILATMLGLANASSASVGQDPSSCGSPTTWKYTTFNVNGDQLLLELRHSYPCNAGWARLSRTSGNAAVAVSLSAWNPGQPSQYGVPGTNWTYTVDATPGNQVCGGFQAWSVDIFGNRSYIGWYYGGCYNT